MSTSVIVSSITTPRIVSVLNFGPRGPSGSVASAWDTTVSYLIGSIVSRAKAGGLCLFISETDDNQGNDPALDDGTNWSLQVKGLPLLVTNKTGATLIAGSAVYVSGAQGNRPTVALALAGAEATDEVLAVVCVDIPDNASGYVAAFGMLGAQDTSAWAAPTKLYLSSTVDGELTDTPPTAPIDVIVVATVLAQHANQGILLIHIGHDPHQYLHHTGGTITGPVETVTEIASAATMTLNMNAGPIHVMDPQDENTTLALSNAGSGKSASAFLKQGAGGGFTIDVPGSWIPMITPDPTTTAGEINEVEVIQVGSDVLYMLKGQA